MRKRTQVGMAVSALAGAVLALTGCSSAGVAEATGDDQTIIEIAAEVCSVSSQVADAGRSITLDTKGEEDSDGNTIETLGCMLGSLGAPDSLVARMDATRALDGMQSGEWDELTATWNYHPDSGMLLIVEESQ